VRPRWPVGCECGWRGQRADPHGRPCARCGISGEKLYSWRPGEGPNRWRVYLLELEWPDGQPDGWHARHYLGRTNDLPRRLLEHRDGRGAKMLAAAVQRGARLEVARVWTLPKEAARELERRLKQRRPGTSEGSRNGRRFGASGSLRRLCPRCVGDAAWRREPEGKLRARHERQPAVRRAIREARRRHRQEFLADVDQQFELLVAERRPRWARTQ
jgi:predicted GIY-YIG superfamily endonuclease